MRIEEIRERRAKRVVFWSLLLSIAWPVALVLVWTMPFELAFYAGPLAILGWILSGIAGLVHAGIAFSQKAQRRAIAILILPASALAAATDVNQLWDTSMKWGQYLHLAAVKSDYQRQVAQMTGDGPKLASFTWGRFVDVTQGVVYDESGEFGQKAEARSAAWNARAAGTLAACEVVDRLPAWDHFYVVRVVC